MVDLQHVCFLSPLRNERWPLSFLFVYFHDSKGDVALLNCTSIVNTSSESLNDKNPVSDSIHQLAGPELRDELLKLKGRKTGKKEGKNDY